MGLIYHIKSSAKDECQTYLPDPVIAVWGCGLKLIGDNLKWILKTVCLQSM